MVGMGKCRAGVTKKDDRVYHGPGMVSMAVHGMGVLKYA